MVSLELRRDIGDKRGIATSLIGLAVAALGQGQAQQAATPFGAAEALRESIDVPPPPFIRDRYDQIVADLRAGLGEKEFTAAWDEGRSMTSEQVIAAITPAASSAVAST